MNGTATCLPRTCADMPPSTGARDFASSTTCWQIAASVTVDPRVTQAAVPFISDPYIFYVFPRASSGTKSTSPKQPGIPCVGFGKVRSILLNACAF